MDLHHKMENLSISDKRFQFMLLEDTIEEETNIYLFEFLCENNAIHIKNAILNELCNKNTKYQVMRSYLLRLSTLVGEARLSDYARINKYLDVDLRQLDFFGTYNMLRLRNEFGFIDFIVRKMGD